MLLVRRTRRPNTLCLCYMFALRFRTAILERCSTWCILQRATPCFMFTIVFCCRVRDRAILCNSECISLCLLGLRNIKKRMLGLKNKDKHVLDLNISYINAYYATQGASEVLRFFASNRGVSLCQALSAGPPSAIALACRKFA